MKTTIIAMMMFMALAVWARQDKTPAGTGKEPSIVCLGTVAANDCTVTGTGTTTTPSPFTEPTLLLIYGEGTGELVIEDKDGKTLLHCVDHNHEVEHRAWDHVTDEITDCKLSDGVTLDVAMTALTQAMEEYTRYESRVR